MKTNYKTASERGYFIVPEEILDQLVSRQDKILELLEAKKEASLNGYITEKRAMEMVNKKITWFWKLRKTGRLPFKKIGNTTYYQSSDIESLLNIDEK